MTGNEVTAHEGSGLTPMTGQVRLGESGGAPPYSVE